MLPRVNRMRRSEDFQRAVRLGSRATSGTLVVHAVESSGGRGPARVGLVVSKAVGNAVARSRVKRRLRHAVRPHLSRCGDALVVIRAKPAAASVDFSRLAADLRDCLTRIERAR